MADKDPLVPLDMIDPGTIHTALRKGTDSDWSCLLWNLVQVCEDPRWIEFVEALRTCMAEGDDFVEAVYRCTSEDALIDKYGNSPDGRAIKWAFALCLKNDRDTLVEVGECLASWARTKEYG